MVRLSKAFGFVLIVTLFSGLVSSFDNNLEESEEEDQKDAILNYSALENPFRVQKINLLWDKARCKTLKFLCH